ncbi:MAG: hypothetical protein HKO59_07775 [Phycisphaerales bacterium]|nr:hypothetical protein [Phycisphaerae bacterium]NNF42138.1 hypothetical protein [Phycisphaerales bacterium]NNM25873.1 hypothetical protein [Phycisphaerales bacterium]
MTSEDQAAAPAPPASPEPPASPPKAPSQPRRTLLILAIVAVAIAAPITWHKQIRFRISPKNFGAVVPGAIYRGADQHINVLRKICDEHAIRTVVDLSGPDAEEDALCRELGIDRYAFDLPGDGRGDPAQWAAVLELVADPARQPIFVHCAAGAQRTTTAMLLYRRYVEGGSFQAAYPESFDFRHEPGDDWVLMAFLADHAEQIEAIRRSGRVDRDGTEVSLDQIVGQALATTPGRP